MQQHNFVTPLRILIAGAAAILFVFLVWPHVTFADAGTSSEAEIVRAQIGVRIQAREPGASRARAREVLKAGDEIRLYVHPEKSAYIYILHDDGRNVNLLNITEQKVQSATLILPSAQSWYVIDGRSNLENLTIICTPQELPEVAVLETASVVWSDWQVLKNTLIENSQLLTVDEPRTPIALAGNIRGMNTSMSADTGTFAADPFLKELEVFSGKGLLIKTYTFRIQE